MIPEERQALKSISRMMSKGNFIGLMQNIGLSSVGMDVGKLLQDVLKTSRWR